VRSSPHLQCMACFSVLDRIVGWFPAMHVCVDIRLLGEMMCVSPSCNVRCALPCASSVANGAGDTYLPGCLPLQTLITPHSAFLTHEALHNIYDTTMENITAFLTGEVPSTLRAVLNLSFPTPVHTACFFAAQGRMTRSCFFWFCGCGCVCFVTCTGGLSTIW